MSKSQETNKIIEVLNKRKNKVALRQDYMNLFVRIIFLVIVGYLIFTQVFLITRVKGNGMFPALKDGDLAIVFRLQQDYNKDDVVSYKADDDRYMGRILARKGDVVNIDENGTLQVNGTLQGGEIMYPTYAKEGIEYPYKVAKDSIFVLGDYRTQTKDSRDFGEISMDNVEGKVITILRRRGL